MSTSLQGIAGRALREPEHGFQDLSRLLSAENLEWCWLFLNKKASPGVDEVDYYRYQENLRDNIASLVERLKSGTYKARLVRRKWIPKGLDKLRPLGIPVIEDKLLQMAVKKILEAIYEADFLECSYGYRPNLGPLDAVKDLTRTLQFGKVSFVVEADIKGFFDNINHQWMIKMLEERIDDRRFLRLIGKWLKAGIMEEDGSVLQPVTGTPQGGIVSPVLANIYLHYALDLWFEKHFKKDCKGEARLIRFCDDFVGLFQVQADAEAFYAGIKGRLEKFHLEVAADKTKVLYFSRYSKVEDVAFEFLSFEYRWGVSRNGMRIVKRRTSRKKLRLSVANFTQWIKENRHRGLKWLMKTLNSKYRGYWNYYGVIGNYASLIDFFEQTKKILFKWINRRSQRLSYNWDSFLQMLDGVGIVYPRITEKVVMSCNSKGGFR